MAEITAQLVKQLREKTGAGMMECKSALVEAKGDLSEAEVVLRKRGLASAAKKATRSTKQGVIGLLIADGGKTGVLVEVNCESDFVARTDDFQSLVSGLAKLIAEASPAGVAGLLALPAPEGLGTVEEMIRPKIAKTRREHGRAAFRAAGREGLCRRVYAPRRAAHHHGRRGDRQSGDCIEPRLRRASSRLAMQVAAADPRFVSRDEVTSETLDKEKDIQRARALAEGKPERSSTKWWKAACRSTTKRSACSNSRSSRTNAVSITQLLADKGKQLGDTLSVASFLRFKVGETGQAEEAAE